MTVNSRRSVPPDEPVEDLATMHSDAHLAPGFTARRSQFACRPHGLLHRHRRADGLLVLLRIGFRAA